ncbi:hypothetical protein Tco_0566402 [Tanacetum coccineum]
MAPNFQTFIQTRPAASFLTRGLDSEYDLHTIQYLGVICKLSSDNTIRSARSNSRVLEEAENSVDRVSSESFSNGVKIKEGGSILEILEEMIMVGQTMGFSMEGCTKDMEKIIGTKENN